MFKNIDIAEINKRQVIRSIWVMLLAAFFMNYASAVLFHKIEIGTIDFFTPLSTVLIQLSFTFLCWILFPLLCWFVEYLMIRQTTNQRGVIRILAIEIGVFIALVFLLLTTSTHTLKIFTVLTLFSAQVIRLIYLKQKDRLFNTANNKSVN